MLVQQMLLLQSHLLGPEEVYFSDKVMQSLFSDVKAVFSTFVTENIAYLSSVCPLHFSCFIFCPEEVDPHFMTPLFIGICNISQPESHADLNYAVQRIFFF